MMEIIVKQIIQNSTGWALVFLRLMIAMQAFMLDIVGNGVLTVGGGFSSDINGDNDKMTTAHAIRPVVTLMSAFQITGGSGTASNAYELQ